MELLGIRRIGSGRRGARRRRADSVWPKFPICVCKSVLDGTSPAHIQLPSVANNNYPYN